MIETIGKYLQAEFQKNLQNKLTKLLFKKQYYLLFKIKFSNSSIYNIYLFQITLYFYIYVFICVHVYIDMCTLNSVQTYIHPQTYLYAFNTYHTMVFVAKTICCFSMLLIIVFLSLDCCHLLNCVVIKPDYQTELVNRFINAVIILNYNYFYFCFTAAFALYILTFLHMHCCRMHYKADLLVIYNL